MTLVSCLAPLQYPFAIKGVGNSAGAFAAGATIDAAGEYDGVVFVAREDMTISEIGWRCNAASGASVDCEIRVETVDATTGLPTGTLWATNTNANSPAPIAANTWYLTSLTADATVTKGQAVAIIWKYKSATSFVISRSGTGYYYGLPYRVSNTGTPAKAGGTVQSLAIGSSTTSFYYIPEFYPLSSASLQSKSTSNADAHGVEFQLPFACRAIGATYYNQATGPGGFSVGIYDGSGNEVSSSLTAFDADYLSSTQTGAMAYCYFDNAVSLSRNTTYRLAYWPDSTTSVGIRTWEIPSSDYSEAMLGGLTWHYVTKAVGGAWDAADTLKYPVLDLIIDQIDDGTGTGGGGIKLAGRGGLAG